RLAAAVQVIRRPHRARERPLALVAPGILTHDEDAHGRAGLGCGVALEMTVEPAQLLAAQVDQRREAEVHLAELLLAVDAVAPRPHEQALVRARLRCAAPRGHPDVIEWRADLLVVVPTGDMQDRHLHALELVLIADAPPVVVELAVL